MDRASAAVNFNDYVALAVEMSAVDKIDVV